jgi:L-seryl-tRNA(Ser) seleniumtransferase
VRALPLPVIGRVSEDRLLLDLRCLEHAAPLVAQWPQLKEALP